MILVYLTTILIGCKPPPQAPDTLEELCEFLFSQMDEEDTASLGLGVDNLDIWLNTSSNLESAIEGYQVHNLTDASVTDLDEEDRSVRETLAGAAVAFQFENSLEDVVRATFVEDWGEISGSYEFYERDFEEPPSCLYNQECTWLEYESHSISKWAGMVTVETYNHGQIRWVETENGWALIRRVWMLEPVIPEPESLGIEVYQTFTFDVTYANSSGTLRTSATWFDTDYGLLPFDEDWAKNQIIKSMQGEAEFIVDWLEDN
jgi:hypothetical protein